MHGITMERSIPLFAIAILGHDRYPGVKSRYLAGDAALVNCDLLELRSILYSKDTKQRALGIPSAPLSNPVAKCVSNKPTQPTMTGRPAPLPTPPPAQTSAVAYPPSGGVP